MDKDSVNRYHKQSEVFPLGHTGQRVSYIFVLILDLFHIFKGTGDIGFYICVHHYEINDGVCLALLQMAALNNPPEA